MTQYSLRSADGTNKVCEFIWIPPSIFWVGESRSFAEMSYFSSKHRHLMKFKEDKGFWLAKYNLTDSQSNSLWKRNSKLQVKKGRSLSWTEAMVLCIKLHLLNKDMIPTGYYLSLPLSYQWEHAFRVIQKNSLNTIDEVLETHRITDEGKAVQRGELRWGQLDRGSFEYCFEAYQHFDDLLGDYLDNAEATKNGIIEEWTDAQYADNYPSINFNSFKFQIEDYFDDIRSVNNWVDLSFCSYIDFDSQYQDAIRLSIRPVYLYDYNEMRLFIQLSKIRESLVERNKTSHDLAEYIIQQSSEIRKSLVELNITSRDLDEYISYLANCVT